MTGSIFPDIPSISPMSIFGTDYCNIQLNVNRGSSSAGPYSPKPNTRTLPTVLLTLPPSKAADMALLCVPQNQALGVCRGFVPDIQVCGTRGKEDLVNATIISNVEEEE